MSGSDLFADWGSRSLEADLFLACFLEATARKPGNVHPQASFADLSYRDFVVSAEAVAPVLARAGELGIGQCVLQAVLKTREAVGRNTNLGIVLLLAPLAAAEARAKGPVISDAARDPATNDRKIHARQAPVPWPDSAGVIPREVLRQNVRDVLNGLTREDASLVYKAIRLAGPGGMGKADAEDIAGEPSQTLVEIMRLAAGRDAIAAQYATGFELVLTWGVPALADWWGSEQERETSTVGAGEDPAMGALPWERAVIALHLTLMAEQPDTLIARKCGRQVAEESAARARGVLAAGWPHGSEAGAELLALDRWLRGDGNRRNPGTTADLVTACLLAALRTGAIEPPPQKVVGDLEELAR